MSNAISYGPPYRLDTLSVLVVGAARSGRAAARLCLREGARVTVTDLRLEVDLTGVEAVTARLGEHREEDFTGADVIIVSPGVPLQLPELQAASRAGVPILGELELAASFLTKLTCIAVTGTNGKSTTTALLGNILREGGLDPFVGGNLGCPLSEAVLDGHAFGALVLELSSYQLESIDHFHPSVAVVLNLTPDHLARHGDMDTYAAAKARIFENQGPADHAVLNEDDSRVSAMAPGLRAQLHRFGTSLGWGEEQYQASSVGLRGPHNQSNAAAAIQAARCIGVSPEAVQRGLDTFAGLPHRLERVRVRNGVEWVNDSKATNVDSAATALRAFDHGVVWIAGGEGKGTSYRPLAELTPGRVKAVLGIGEEGPVIIAAVGASVAENAVTLDVAVGRAEELAVDGDTVLLAPACASFDQFDDYEQRGETFRTLVEALP